MDLRNAIDKKLLDKRIKYQQAAEESKRAREKESALLKDLRESCNHPSRFIAEISPRSNTLENYLPAFRVCEICGYKEINQGRGYNLLKNKKVYFIPREQGEKLVFPIKDIED